MRFIQNKKVVLKELSTEFYPRFWQYNAFSNYYFIKFNPKIKGFSKMKYNGINFFIQYVSWNNKRSYRIISKNKALEFMQDKQFKYLSFK